MRHLTAADDVLLSGLPAGGDQRFFDRFYFNLHGAEPTPFIMLGAGSYPGAALVDGYVIAVDGDVQRNLRFSTEHTGPAHAVGPLSWQTLEPLRKWALRLAPNPLGVELDVVWTARTAPWRTEDIRVDNGRGGISDFAHFFQSGRYDGSLSIDGQRYDVGGWFGQRDRSRGVRIVAGGQGIHLWVQAQFPDRSVAFILDENRSHEVILCDGAVLHETGEADPVISVEHDLTFDANLDFRHGRLYITTAGGEQLEVHVDGTAGGGFLSGGGYGGWHGVPHGRDHLEHDMFPLDGSVSPRRLDMPLTDRPARFTSAGVSCAGVFEFAHTRSSSYTYRQSLSRAG